MHRVQGGNLQKSQPGTLMLFLFKASALIFRSPCFVPRYLFFCRCGRERFFSPSGLRYIRIYNLTLTPSSVTPTTKRRSNVLYVSAVTVCRLIVLKACVASPPPSCIRCGFLGLDNRCLEGGLLAPSSLRRGGGLPICGKGGAPRVVAPPSLVARTGSLPPLP